ncbi:MAG: hypothetical protein A3F18_05465 [Legionellales bacterium RIFCSPHIGHO2_12_FULL_37_14]|nr:MAG: hypothetical protein A3F18_05465 [Legionellales bacterium RIFCSPHIGHO2_12_FULL_37_14]
MSDLTLFYKPITRANEEHNFSQNIKQLIQISLQCLLASAAVYLVIQPSIKYSENDDAARKFILPFSTIITGFLLNLYATRRLIYEIENGVSVFSFAVISVFLGSLFSLPAFFLELQLAKNKLMAGVVLFGTTPMQALGTWTFVDLLRPYWRKAYYMLYRNQSRVQVLKHQAELNAVFLTHLTEASRSMLTSNSTLDFSCRDPDTLLNIIFTHRMEIRQRGALYLTASRRVGIAFGFMGAFLAEIINLSFAKATFDILSAALPYGSAFILTCAIVLPMIVLSAEFGYHGIKKSWTIFSDIVYNFAYHNDSNSRHLRLPPPIGIAPLLATNINLGMVLIASFSYAALVQFNNETLKDTLANEELKAINELTKIGGIIFNAFGLLSISNDIVSFILTLYKNRSISERAKFFRFIEAVKTGYCSLFNTGFFDERIILYLSMLTLEDEELINLTHGGNATPRITESRNAFFNQEALAQPANSPATTVAINDIKKTPREL